MNVGIKPEKLLYQPKVNHNLLSREPPIASFPFIVSLFNQINTALVILFEEVQRT